MNENTRKLFRKVIVQAEILVEDEYKQLSEIDNVVLAGKESANSSSGFLFLVLQRNEEGEVIFRNVSEEFQNASTTYVLRANLNLYFSPEEEELEQEV